MIVPIVRYCFAPALSRERSWRIEAQDPDQSCHFCATAFQHNTTSTRKREKQAQKSKHNKASTTKQAPAPTTNTSDRAAGRDSQAGSIVEPFRLPSNKQQA